MAGTRQRRAERPQEDELTAVNSTYQAAFGLWDACLSLPRLVLVRPERNSMLSHYFGGSGLDPRGIDGPDGGAWAQPVLGRAHRAAISLSHGLRGPTSLRVG